MASVWKTAGMGAAAGLAVPVAGLSGLAAAGFALILVLAMFGVGPARLSQPSLWGLLTGELMLYLLISLAIFTLSFRFLARLQARCQALVAKINAQLFGFTGTPIFEKNASYQQIEGQQASYRTTDDLFQRCLHQYTITHAIEDRNVLRFHVDYFKPEGKNPPKPGEGVVKPKVIDNLQTATQKLADFMQSQGVGNAPEDVANLKGDAAWAQFVNLFKEVQRLKTQLDKYTDLSDEQKAQITQIAPPDQMQGFKGVYLETAKRLKEQQDRDQTPPEVQQLDFEFVLFASSVIDYDYIMGLIAKLTQQKPGKLTMNREQLIGLIQSDAKFIDEREDIAEYIRGLPVNEALDEKQIRSGFDRFKAEKKTRELTDIANRHALDVSALQAFVDEILRRRIFDGERLSELMAPLNLGWKARTQKELALMEELAPLLHKLAQGREIAGLAAYEEGR